MTTIAEKVLFLEFLGYREENTYTKKEQIKNTKLKKIYRLDDFNPIDWDILDEITRNVCKIKGFENIENDIKEMRENAKIEDVYNSCLSLIKHYKELNKPYTEFKTDELNFIA